MDGDVQLAECSHVDDRNDQAKDDGWEFVSQLEQPEEKRHGGQLDADAGEQQGARPIGLAALKQQIAGNQGQCRDDDDRDVGQFCGARSRGLPD